MHPGSARTRMFFDNLANTLTGETEKQCCFEPSLWSARNNAFKALLRQRLRLTPNNRHSSWGGF